MEIAALILAIFSIVVNVLFLANYLDFLKKTKMNWSIQKTINAKLQMNHTTQQTSNDAYLIWRREYLDHVKDHHE